MYTTVHTTDRVFPVRLRTEKDFFYKSKIQYLNTQKTKK
nr:MAG TPA: hypothetical protein [Caudoviricetes sp.]